MNEFEVTVTKEHLDKAVKEVEGGNEAISLCCVIWQALNDMFPNEVDSVGISCARVKEVVYGIINADYHKMKRFTILSPSDFLKDAKELSQRLPMTLKFYCVLVF